MAYILIMRIYISQSPWDLLNYNKGFILWDFNKWDSSCCILIPMTNLELILVLKIPIYIAIAYY